MTSGLLPQPPPRAALDAVPPCESAPLTRDIVRTTSEALGLSESPAQREQQRSLQLILAIQEGDPAAAVALYDQHRASVYSYLVRMSSQQQADDLLQDVWLAVFKDIDRYDMSRASFRSWLFGIAHNRLRSEWRRQQRLQEEADESIESRTDDALPSPEDQAAVRARIVDLEHCLGSMPARLRAVLLLALVEGLSHGEIAAALGIENAASRARLRRGRLWMQRCLSGRGTP